MVSPGARGAGVRRRRRHGVWELPELLGPSASGPGRGGKLTLGGDADSTPPKLSRAGARCADTHLGKNVYYSGLVVVYKMLRGLIKVNLHLVTGSKRIFLTRW